MGGGGGGGSGYSSGGNSGMYNGFYNLGQGIGQTIGKGLFGDPQAVRNQAQALNNRGIQYCNNGQWQFAINDFAAALAKCPQDQVIRQNLAFARGELAKEEQAALARQKAEAERQKQETYNRLSSKLKLSEGFNSGQGGLSLKDLRMGDSDGGHVGVRGLPGLYLNSSGSGSGGTQPGTSKLPLMMGDDNGGSGRTGVRGLPGLYANDPGSGETQPGTSKLPLMMGDDSGDSGHVGVRGLPGLALNDKTGNGSTTPYGIPGLPGTYVNGPGSGSGIAQPGASKLPLMMGDDNKQSGQAQNAATEPIHSNGTAGPSQSQTAIGSAPAALQQNANAMQTAAAAPVLDDASLKARTGFDTPLGPMATPPVSDASSGRLPAPPVSPQTPISAVAASSGASAGPSQPSNTQSTTDLSHQRELISQFMFPGNSSPPATPQPPNAQSTDLSHQRELISQFMFPGNSSPSAISQPPNAQSTDLSHQRELISQFMFPGNASASKPQADSKENVLGPNGLNDSSLELKDAVADSTGKTVFDKKGAGRDLFSANAHGITALDKAASILQGDASNPFLKTSMEQAKAETDRRFSTAGKDAGQFNTVVLTGESGLPQNQPVKIPDEITQNTKKLDQFKRLVAEREALDHQIEAAQKNLASTKADPSYAESSALLTKGYNQANALESLKVMRAYDEKQITKMVHLEPVDVGDDSTQPSSRTSIDKIEVPLPTR